MDRVDVTVVGGGPVGLFASFYAGLRGMSVRIIDSLPELGGQLNALYPEKFIYDMPGFPKVLARDLARELIAQGTQFGPHLALEHTAQDLIEEPDGYTIVTHRGLRLPTRTVVISAGAGAFTPTPLGVPREEEYVGRGLSYGVRQVSAFEGRDVVIVGGGDSAFDWALALEPIARSVTLVHRRDQFRAHEDTVAKVRASSVRFRLWTIVRELHGEERLEAITVENTQTGERDRIDLDALVVNVGYKASLGPLANWGLEIVKNQIKVDSFFRTNRPGIFAVGDVATFEGKIKLIATGVGEAAIAVCYIKTLLDPTAKLFPGHSSDLELPAPAAVRAER